MLTDLGHLYQRDAGVNRRAGRLVSRGRIHRDGVPRLPRRILLRLLHSFPVAVLAGCLLSWALTGVDPVAKLIYAWNLPVGGGPIASRHTGAELMYDGGTVVEVTLAAVVMAARPPPARRTRSAAFVLQIAGQQPVPEGEIRAPLHAETTGDDDGE